MKKVFFSFWASPFKINAKVLKITHNAPFHPVPHCCCDFYFLSCWVLCCHYCLPFLNPSVHERSLLRAFVLPAFLPWFEPHSRSILRPLPLCTLSLLSLPIALLCFKTVFSFIELTTYLYFSFIVEVRLNVIIIWFEEYSDKNTHYWDLVYLTNILIDVFLLFPKITFKF